MGEALVSIRLCLDAMHLQLMESVIIHRPGLGNKRLFLLVDICHLRSVDLDSVGSILINYLALNLTHKNID